ncbi:kinase binding protein CGI-121-domain-containing protein [Crassisporium funariophilum]|nr:kinase binding protein CGI-121-domain-containing protein [Crassisporium funariophilum]
MESLYFRHFQAKHSCAHVALFRNVSNAGTLKKRIIAASTAEGQHGEQERDAVNFAFIDARLITSKLLIETAISQAILAESQGALRTKTVHSEILFNLNPTHNITEAIRRYGVSESNTDVIVVKIDSRDLAPETVEENMKAVIDGTVVQLSELEGVTDWPSVKKYHKLNGEMAIKEAAGNPVRERVIVDNIVVSSVAMKSVMN